MKALTLTLLLIVTLGICPQSKAQNGGRDPLCEWFVSEAGVYPVGNEAPLTMDQCKLGWDEDYMSEAPEHMIPDSVDVIIDARMVDPDAEYLQKEMGVPDTPFVISVNIQMKMGMYWDCLNPSNSILSKPMAVVVKKPIALTQLAQGSGHRITVPFPLKRYLVPLEERGENGKTFILNQLVITTELRSTYSSSVCRFERIIPVCE